MAFTYDAANRRTRTTLPNGVTINYSYDAASQLTAITYTQGASTIGNLTYTYDASGRRTGVGGSVAAASLPPPIASALYNANNQLTSWNGRAFNYDLKEFRWCQDCRRCGGRRWLPTLTAAVRQLSNNISGHRDFGSEWPGLAGTGKTGDPRASGRGARGGVPGISCHHSIERPCRPSLAHDVQSIRASAGTLQRLPHPLRGERHL